MSGTLPSWDDITKPSLIIPTQIHAGPVQVWLQEWAWTESAKAKDVEKRNAGDGSAHMDPSKLQGEPMFCYETCVKLLYWTALVYDYRLDGVCTAVKPSICRGCMLAQKDSQPPAGAQAQTCCRCRQALCLLQPRASWPSTAQAWEVKLCWEKLQFLSCWPGQKLSHGLW